MTGGGSDARISLEGVGKRFGVLMRAAFGPGFESCMNGMLRRCFPRYRRAAKAGR